MPTFKHPCPHCGTFINRDVAACPSCGHADPFAPERCANCRATLDDPGWVACPACGKPVGAAAIAAAAGTAEETSPKRGSAGPTTVGPPAGPAAATATTTRPCSGCAAPLPVGAPFCRECGTAAG